MGTARFVAGMRLFLILFCGLTVSLWADEPAAKPPLTAEQKDKLKDRDQLRGEAAKLRSAGKLDEAAAAFEKAITITREIYGNGSEETALGLIDLANIHEDREDFAAAGKIRQEILDIDTKRFGKDHWEVTDARLALEHVELLAKLDPKQREKVRQAAKYHSGGIMHYGRGHYPEAKLLYLQAIRIRKEVLGEKHRDYAQSLHNLAVLYHKQAEYAKAEPLYRQALRIRQEILGEKHHDYTQSLDKLALLYRNQGEYAKAEPLCRQALRISKEVHGEKHLAYAQNLTNLAGVYYYQGEYAKAEPLVRQALQIRKEALGEKHLVYAGSLNDLAHLYHAQGEFAKAEPLYRQAHQVFNVALGEQHPDYIRSLMDLALLYRQQGEYAKAEPLYRQVLQVYKEAGGEKHPSYTFCLYNLARLYQAQENFAKAEPLYRQAYANTGEELEKYAEYQSEQAQLAVSQSQRYLLDDYLRNSEKARTPAEEVYSLILSWKGAITARQQLARLARSALAGDPEVAKLFQELESVSRLWAKYSLFASDLRKFPDLPAKLQALSARHEHLEAELSRRTADFRRFRESRNLKPADLRKLLPEETVLLDFVEYGAGKEARLVVFVVDKKQVQRVELGESAPINDAIDRFRNMVRRTRPVMNADDPALMLREKLWQPIEKHLTGVKLLLLSPDGQLGQLPFALLPDKTGEKYILEDVSLAVVPVPRMLHELLDPAATVKDDQALPLLVGDVDFGALPGKPGAAAANRSAVRGNAEGQKLEWRPLEGTRAEIDGLRKTFGKQFPERRPRVLLKEEATEEALRREAPRHRWLHLATHGFFAPPHVRSALAQSQRDAKRFADFGQERWGPSGYDPQLLSGIVLAGANRVAEPGQDDGILTAREVAEMDLSKVELAVLSACETGLGQAAGGEGVLGLQRAFQIAGARTSMTSLWQVPDEATRVLMERYYGNLWEKKMPKLAALREAQLWMLKEGKAHPGIQRGLGREDAPKPDDTGRLPPYYWAAFVLSGDWR